ncbi:MAG: hypothetical protein ACK55I_36650, partial [bacterium]
PRPKVDGEQHAGANGEEIVSCRQSTPFAPSPADDQRPRNDDQGKPEPPRGNDERVSGRQPDERCREGDAHERKREHQQGRGPWARRNGVAHRAGEAGETGLTIITAKLSTV